MAAAPNAASLIFHPSPSISRPLNQLTEDEQVRIAQRMGLINHLPLNKFDGTLKKAKEYEFVLNCYCYLFILVNRVFLLEKPLVYLNFLTV